MHLKQKCPFKCHYIFILVSKREKKNHVALSFVFKYPFISDRQGVDLQIRAD